MVVVFSVLPIISFAIISPAPTTGVNTQNGATIKDEIEARKEALKKEAEAKKENFKQELENKKETLKQEMASRTDAIKNSVEERRQNVTNKIADRVNQFLKNVIERYNAAINRLVKLADRIDSRIAKLEANKIDVSKAKELMVTARAKIEVAKASISAITNTITGTNLATTTGAIKTQFQDTKGQMEKVKSDIKNAQAALVDVVNSLKPGDNKLREQLRSKEHATSTATTTGSND